MKKLILSVVFCLCLLSSSSVSYASTYTMTEEQMIQLINNLEMLEYNNNRLLEIYKTQSNELNTSLMDCKKLQEQLKASQTELNLLLTQLQQSKKSLEIANKELEIANQSYKKYKKQKQIELATWQTIALGLAFGLAVK